MSLRFGGALALSMALMSAGCESPPTRELAAAEAEVRRALEGDADVFAPKELDEAEDALQAARRQMARKEYRATLSAALDASQKARTALAATESAKRGFQTRAQGVLKSAEESLARATQIILPKSAAKPPRDLAECQTAFDRTRDFAETLSRHLSEADLVAVHEEIPVVKDAVERLDKACAPGVAAPRVPGRRPSSRGTRAPAG